MGNIPKILFKKASACGFKCVASDHGDYRIEPRIEPDHWYLTYQKGRWVLSTHGVPQIYFQYEEVMTFLDRFMDKVASDVKPENPVNL